MWLFIRAAVDFLLGQIAVSGFIGGILYTITYIFENWGLQIFKGSMMALVSRYLWSQAMAELPVDYQQILQYLGLGQGLDIVLAAAIFRATFVYF